MRILTYGKIAKNYINDWQRYHIQDELKRHKCDIEYFNVLDYKSVEEANEKLIEYCKANKVDLFFTEKHDGELYLETLVELKKLGIPTVLGTGDHLFVAYDLKNLCKYFDLIWFAAPGLEDMFRKWGANVVYLPSAANPYFLKPQDHFEEINRVGFVGNPHGSRSYVINQLLKANVPVTLHNKKPKNDVESLQADTGSKAHIIKGEIRQFSQWIRYPVGRELLKAAALKRLHTEKLSIESHSLIMEEQVPFAELSMTLQKFALSLNFSEGLSTAYLKRPISMIPLRCFEIPMAGGVQFIRRTPELEVLFEDGKEIIYFDDYGDMVEKAEFWLRDEQKAARDKIRNAARARAEAEHTWWHRYTKIFEILGIKYD